MNYLQLLFLLLCKVRTPYLYASFFHSLSSSQMKLLLTLGLPFLFNALQMFVRWIQVGQYDFHTLPFILKSNLNPQDVIALQQICDKIDGEQITGVDIQAETE